MPATNTTERSYTFTYGDLEAHALLMAAGELPCCSTDMPLPTESGNRIIELAERIKAQRLTLAMQR